MSLDVEGRYFNVQPWVIRQADYLAFLAHRFDFDADTVWNDEANADIRTLRSDPNMLAAGDVLHIPDQTSAEPKTFALTTGQVNEFVSDAPLIDVAVKFVGGDAETYASKAYTVEELDHLTDLTTDGDGVATFKAPVTVQTLTVAFTDSGERRRLIVGGMDPVETLSGILKRLQNLGYVSSSLDFESVDLDVLRAGLVALKQATQPDDDDPPASGPTSGPVSGSGPQVRYTGPSGSASSVDLDADMMPTPAEDGDSSSPAPDASAAPPSSTSPDSAPASSPDPSSAVGDAPSQADDNDSESDAPSDAPAVDDAGLSEDGKLDDEMKSLLLRAHGY